MADNDGAGSTAEGILKEHGAEGLRVIERTIADFRRDSDPEMIGYWTAVRSAYLALKKKP